MQQITMNLDEKQQRPVIILENGLTALLDTGAYVPVWVDEERVLSDSLGGQFIRGGVPLSGFGGMTKGNLYQVTMKIGKLIYPNMHMIANSELLCPFHMILSATMFRGLVYEINDRQHRLNITVPDDQDLVRNLKIQDSDGKMHVLCGSVTEEPKTE